MKPSTVKPEKQSDYPFRDEITAGGQPQEQYGSQQERLDAGLPELVKTRFRSESGHGHSQQE